MFRDRLLISVLLTVPILYFSEAMQDWFGFEAISFTGSELVTPILSTILYFYGGGPFLKGSLRELQGAHAGDDDVDRDRHHRCIWVLGRRHFGVSR
jgi:P-type Cu2+ transporter